MSCGTGRFWIGWGDICARDEEKQKEADVRSASGHFGVCGELVKCDAFGLASEIDLYDAVRVEEDFSLARLLCELNPFTRNRCDSLAIVGSDDADLILAVVRFEIVCPGFQLLRADSDGMIDHQLSRIGAGPDGEREN